ncbi:hypothetical protein COCON_G00225370 [Conger conger]|uniref:Uncharacterized protein n=1 Tax=Conger conger TaxID=82655 RepID=A0A9Q1CWE7_CONCO|nr:hypothetical protein COCON_G00225370 [Conger conger]
MSGPVPSGLNMCPRDGGRTGGPRSACSPGPPRRGSGASCPAACQRALGFTLGGQASFCPPESGCTQFGLAPPARRLQIGAPNATRLDDIPLLHFGLSEDCGIAVEGFKSGKERDTQLSAWLSLDQVEPIIIGRLDQILEEKLAARLPKVREAREAPHSCVCPPAAVSLGGLPGWAEPQAELRAHLPPVSRPSTQCSDGSHSSVYFQCQTGHSFPPPLAHRSPGARPQKHKPRGIVR